MWLEMRKHNFKLFCAGDVYYFIYYFYNHIVSNTHRNILRNNIIFEKIIRYTLNNAFETSCSRRMRNLYNVWIAYSPLNYNPEHSSIHPEFIYFRRLYVFTFGIPIQPLSDLNSWSKTVNFDIIINRYLFHCVS